MLTGCRRTLRSSDIGRSATPAHGRTRPPAADSFDRATLRRRLRDGTVDDAQSSCGGSAVVGRRSTAELALRVQPCHTMRSDGTVDDAQSSCGGSAVVGRRSTAELASRVQPCHTTRSDGTVDDAQSSCGGSAVVGRRSTAELASRVQPCHTTRSGGTVDGVRRRRTTSPVTRRPRAGTAPRSSSRKMGRPAGDLLGRDVRRCPRPDRTVSALDRFREDQIPRMMLKKPYPDRD